MDGAYKETEYFRYSSLNPDRSMKPKVEMGSGKLDEDVDTQSGIDTFIDRAISNSKVENIDEDVLLKNLNEFLFFEVFISTLDNLKEAF